MAINCRLCRYYYITWDKKFPNGCKAFGFKTVKMPSFDVRSSSGEECSKYAPKAGPSNTTKPR